MFELHFPELLLVRRAPGFQEAGQGSCSPRTQQVLLLVTVVGARLLTGPSQGCRQGKDSHPQMGSPHGDAGVWAGKEKI